jgi:hypothetical protein
MTKELKGKVSILFCNLNNRVFGETKLPYYLSKTGRLMFKSYPSLCANESGGNGMKPERLGQFSIITLNSRKALILVTTQENYLKDKTHFLKCCSKYFIRVQGIKTSEPKYYFNQKQELKKIPYLLQAFKVICGKEPPIELVENWIKFDEEQYPTLQDWALNNRPLPWMMGISIIDAAFSFIS